MILVFQRARLSENLRKVFTNYPLLGELSAPRQGLATADNERFLRLWWEVATSRTALHCTSREEAQASGARWFPFNKGGDFRKWYGNQEYVVNWQDDGREIRRFGLSDGGKLKSRPQNTEYYFSPSVSWSSVSSGDPAFRYYPTGFVFSNAGNSLFSGGLKLEQWLLLLNSHFTTTCLETLSPTLNFAVGYIAGIPVASNIVSVEEDRIHELICQARDDWNQSEVSWNFQTNPLIPDLRRH